MKKAIACWWFLLPVAGALGQSLTALSGSVLDPTNAVVPEATVTLENLDTRVRRETVSDSEGRYAFPQIPPGNYRVTAKAGGFADASVERMRLSVATPAVVNIQFTTLGAAVQQVVVEARAPQVSTTDASLGNAISNQAIMQLPLEARNVVGLLSLQPGVTYVTSAVDDPRNGAVSGGKPDQANVLLDGIDVNDQRYRDPFTSVLRVTLDSVQEFRVTTTNASADQGRSSGAQIALVTKSGTNGLHGSVYEYHRNTVTTANSFFNNLSGVPRAKLIRNLFGGAVGGPVIKNRLFYFFNYEGRRDRSESNVLRKVPSETLRQGYVKYLRANGSMGMLTPQDLATRIDPLGIGASQAVLQLFQSYPLPNDPGAGDGVNILGFRFRAAQPSKQDTYISRFDYALDAGGRHSLFWRGNLQNDRSMGAPQFPGEPAASVGLNNSKGLAAGYTGILRPNLIATLRYGLTRPGSESTGVQTASMVTFRNIDSRYAQSKGSRQFIPVHHTTQDLNWIKGAHNVQFGATLRWIRSSALSLGNSFHTISVNPNWLTSTGAELSSRVPDLSPANRSPFNDAIAAVLGLVTQVTARYNYDTHGNVLPVGTPIRRDFNSEEYEMYVQDTWRLSPALTVTAGLRYSLMPPIEEARNQQASLYPNMDEWFNKRIQLAQQGRSQAEAGKIQYVAVDDPLGSPLYPYHKKNFAPRLAVGYSPQATEGWRRLLLGGPGRSLIRAGWGMYYDLFGSSIIRRFDTVAYGFSTSLSNPGGILTMSTAPRFVSLTELPAAITPAAPKGGLPAVAPENFANTTGIDQGIKPPYSLNATLSVSRDLPGGFTVVGAYVGRFSRRSLVYSDLAQPTNLVDPASGQDYYSAARALIAHINAKTPTAQVPNVAFWENLWPKAAGGGKTATQAIYDVFRSNASDWTSALQAIDQHCRPACSVLGPYAMFNSQFSYLSALRSIGGGSYHAMQWTVRKQFAHGVLFDANYAWSKSIDLQSYAEWQPSYGQMVITNAFNKRQNRAVSYYDMTHQFNANWVAELPFGRGKPLLGKASGLVNGLLGGWQISGLWRHTSGMPYSVDNGRNWPTNWNNQGWATQIGVVPKSKTSRQPVTGVGPNVFEDPKTVLAAYTFTLPGESGQRHGIRGDGFFNLDLGLGKRFLMPYREGHSLQFRWEVFNVGNNNSFALWNESNLSLGNATVFGRYHSTYSSPRVMQFGLRYEY